MKLLFTFILTAMGVWGAGILENDTSMDIYDNFYYYYNKGEAPSKAAMLVRNTFEGSFDDEDERYDCLFGLAMALWETKSLGTELYNEVRDIILSGKDLERWRDLGATEEIINRRKIIIDEFLEKISTEKNIAKPRESN